MPQEGVYLELLEGRHNEADELRDGGEKGPIFGPLTYVEVTNGKLVKLGLEVDHYELQITRGLVYYDGVLYGDFTVFFEQSDDCSLARHTVFDQTKALIPATTRQLLQ